MRLVSLNAWGGRVHGPLLRFLRDADPDVLCLQEVTRTAAPASPWLTYRDGDLTLPQRADLFGDMKRCILTMGLQDLVGTGPEFPIAQHQPRRPTRPMKNAIKP